MRARRFIAIVAVTAAGGTIALAGSAAARDDDFRATMNGASEVPGPGDPDGTAKARVEIDIAASEVCFRFDWENIAAPTVGHIHPGAVGVAGPPVVDLLNGISLDTLEADDDIEGCVTADPGLLGQIVAAPDQYYVNLHNERFPGGAVRGQLEPR
jgi:hypothetical protein